jgi:hypothetical protein
MKAPTIKVLICLAAFFAFGNVSAEDMQSYLQKTRELAQEGEYQEALRRFIWFHEHALEYEPAMCGVRLSFALMYWNELGEVYPPADSALIEIRDKAVHQIENGQGDSALFSDVVALNRTLGEESETVLLFRNLSENQPDLARQCWGAAKEAIMNAKQYDLAAKYVSDPVEEFEKARTRYDLNTTFYHKLETSSNDFKRWNENALVEESLRLIELSLALGDRNAAIEIMNRASAVVKDGRLKESIPEEQ